MHVPKMAQGFPPRVPRFTATVARPPPIEFRRLHRMVEEEHKLAASSLYLENIARFTRAEMAACMDAENNQLLAAYTIVYFYAPNQVAKKVLSRLLPSLAA